MKETLNYIKVLNWGYGAFCGSFGDIAPLTLSPDFHSSIEQLEKRLALLEQLSYDNLLLEATSDNGKANLKRYKSTGTTFEYQLHFMRDREQVLEALQTMSKGFKDYVDKLKADGLWSDEQWREYKVTLSQIGRQFEERLEQFATAFDELPTIYNMKAEKEIFSKAIEKGYMRRKGNSYEWLHKISLLAYMCGRLYCEDKVERNQDGSTILKKGGNFPAHELKKLFGLDVANNRYQLDVPPLGYKMIDELFEL